MVTRIGLLADAHGDVAALRRSFELLEQLEVDRMWFLGDLIGDPSPNETIALAMEVCEVVVAGNHDLLAVRRIDESYLSTHGPSVPALREALHEVSEQTLRDLPQQAADGTMRATHASLDHPTARIEDSYEAAAQLALCDEHILAVGHHHRAFAYLEEGLWVDDVVERGVVVIPTRAVVCPGSLVEVAGESGTVCVVVVDDDRRCEWHRVPR